MYKHVLIPTDGTSLSRKKRSARKALGAIERAACWPRRRFPSSSYPEGLMHYHYFTLEQRDALEAQIRATVASEPALQLALQQLHQPDYGVCIDCGRDIAFVRLRADPHALHCAECARLPIKLG